MNDFYLAFAAIRLVKECLAIVFNEKIDDRQLGQSAKFLLLFKKRKIWQI
jgi:hypothetical protein